MRRALVILACLALAACASDRARRNEPARADARHAEIGRSVQGRPILARTIGAGPRRVYLIGGIHGDEPEGLRAMPAILAVLAEPEVFRAVTVRVVRDMNPDGTASGRRGNSRGVDLNRNWPARNFSASKARGTAALSEPETTAVLADLERFDPELVIVLHSSRSGPFVNFDGPGEECAAAFADAAGSPWRVVPSMGYPTPGSLGSLIGIDRGLPILTVEFERGATHLGASAAAGIRATVRACEISGGTGAARW